VARKRGIARTSAVLALIGAVAAAIWCGIVVVEHASKEVYGIPGWGVGVTLGLLALSALGSGLVLWSRQAEFSAIVLVIAALAVLGLVSIFSFGVLALLLAGGLLVRGHARWPSRRGAAALIGGALAGAPLPLLVIFAASGPLVRCEANGSSSEENVFLAMASAGGSGASSGSGTTGPNGSDSGHAQGEGYEYSYVCRNQKLVRFELRWR
jgi:hypothetical protein